MRRAAKRDTTEPEIVGALLDAGAGVCVLDQFDLLVLFRGGLFMIDCKSQGGKPTPTQQRFIDRGWPLHFCETPEQALKVIGLG